MLGLLLFRLRKSPVWRPQRRQHMTDPRFMGPRSALARMQQVLVAALLATSVSWVAIFWRHSLALALTGGLLILISHSVFLAIEFFVLWRFGRRGISLPTRATEIFRAWWHETFDAIQTFYWRQPFRWRVYADNLTTGVAGHPRRGVVLVHGFVCNRGFWNPWMRRLRDQKQPFVAINLEPVFGSIERYVATIEDAVSRITDATGRPPVVVCHSMGGLAVRAWLRIGANLERVEHVFTIGTPHAGTWLARFSVTQNARQMQMNSEWLELQRRAESVSLAAKFTCWYSNCDNVVFPVQTATLPHAHNRLVRGAAHVDLAFHELVMADTLAFIARPLA